MSVLQYPRNAYFSVVTNSPHVMGSYELPSDGDLTLSHVRFFHKKSGAYSYTLKLQVSATASGPTLVESDTVTFSDTTTGQATEYWLGDVTFDFDEYALKAGETYFFRLVTTGYTRPSRPNENSAYLALWCDWLEPIGTANTGGIRQALGVKR